MTSVPTRKKNLNTETGAQREDGHVTTEEAEIGVSHLLSYGTPRIDTPSEARRGKDRFPLGAFRESTALPTP